MPQIIDANELTIDALLNTSGQAYIVPRHQRQFEWTKEQWSDLWEDIHTGEVEESHFLGSIVVIPEGRPLVGINYFEVNDGQQRLTTILIVLSVIRDHATLLNNADFVNHITSQYLTANCFEKGSKKVVPKMKLGKLDDEEFRQVLEGKLQGEEKEGHRIFDCYNYFKSLVKNLNLEQLENLEKRIVSKIIVVHINVADQFNAFRLFETLNDRGLALSAVDLIKNHLLMRAASTGDDQIIDSIVEEWQEMYETIREYDPVVFFHRFMLAEYQGKISAKELYEVIKQRAKNEKWDSQTILQFTNKLNKASTIYTELIDANIGNLSINRGLTDIKHIQAGPSYSLLLRITPLFKEGLLNETQYLEIIKLIELFHIRWGITGQSTSRLNEIYNRMCTKLNGTPAEAVSKMIEDEYLSWASPIKDSMFLSAFQKEFGKPGDTRTKYIIWKLGNPAGEISLNFDEVHTEHIMPQTLSEGWVQNLEQASGKNNEEIIKSHSVLVNKIGNLSLIKGDWNISMSNRLFSDKKQYYANSEISLTKELANRNKWTFDEVVNRTKEFAEKAVQIWKFSKPIPEIETAAENVNRIRREKYKLDSNIQLYCKGPAAEGIAHIIDNNIVRVLKGSRARLDCSPSFETHVYKIKRDQLISEGILKKEGDSLIFTSDYDFDHTSPAAAIILGKASNGWTSWKDDNGIDLDHLIHKNNVVADKFEDKLKMGQVYLKENIEEIFNTNFGGRIKGITLRRDSAENQYIILFKVKNSKYKDFGSKDKFVYYGEGGDADQKLTPANQALISAIDDRRTIYGFWQDEGGSGYEYIGTLLIDSYEYTLEPESGYKVYKFNVDRVGLDSKDNKD